MVAKSMSAAERDDRSTKAAHALIAERGLGRFATFDEVSEGERFPDGTESMSGHVVAEDGRVYFFWMDWEAAQGRPTLGTWKEVTDEIATPPTGEYRRARKAVGLA
jgi:hypothetical protein